MNIYSVFFLKKIFSVRLHESLLTNSFPYLSKAFLYNINNSEEFGEVSARFAESAVGNILFILLVCISFRIITIFTLKITTRFH